MVAPAFILMCLLLLGPLLGVIALSFTDYQLGSPTFAWIGLENYREMLADRVFWTSLRNTLTYVAIVVPAAVALGLGVALLIESGSSLRAWYRTIYFLPVMATLIAMSIVWEFMLHPQFGLVNGLLHGIGLEGYSWLQDRRTALYALCVIGIWQALGFNMVLFLAGLVSIPRQLYDAAEIDGAHGALGAVPAGDMADAGADHGIRRGHHRYPFVSGVRHRPRADQGRAVEIVRSPDPHHVCRGLRVLPLRLWRGIDGRVPDVRAAADTAQIGIG